MSEDARHVPEMSGEELFKLAEAIMDDCQKEHQANYAAEQDRSVWGPDGPQQGRNECVGVSPIMRGGNDINSQACQSGNDIHAPAMDGGGYAEYVAKSGLEGGGAGSPGAMGPGYMGPRPGPLAGPPSDFALQYFALQDQIDRMARQIRTLKEEAEKRQVHLREMQEDLGVMSEVANSFARMAIRQDVRPAFGVSYREAAELFSDIAQQLRIITGQTEVKGETATNSASRDKHCRLMVEAIEKEIAILLALIRRRRDRICPGAGEEAVASLAAKIRAADCQDRQAKAIGRAAAALEAEKRLASRMRGEQPGAQMETMDKHGYSKSHQVKRLEGPGPGQWYAGYDPNVAKKSQ